MKLRINFCGIAASLIIVSAACDANQNPVMDQKPGDLIFAATYEQGVFRTDDNGGTWEPRNSGLANTKVAVLARNHSDTFFAGTIGSGVFRSADRGGSWMPANQGISDKRVFSLLINAEGDLFANTGDEIFRSKDSGDSWTDISGIINRSIRTIILGINDEIFAGTSGGLLVSKNNGDSWDLTDFNMDVDRIATNAAGHLFVGTELRGMHRSTDGGNTWESINNGAPDHANFAMGVNPLGQDLYVGIGVSLYRSENNGDSWNEVLSLNHIIWSLGFNSSGDIFAGTLSPSEDEIGEGDGVYLSLDNGASWRQIGLDKLNVLAFLVVTN